MILRNVLASSALAIALAGCGGIIDPRTGALHAPGESAEDASAAAPYNRPGYVTTVAKGRLWVFKKDSKGHEEFLKSGEPAKQVTRIGAGPLGMTLRSDDAAVIDGYLLAAPGFSTHHRGTIGWIFKPGSSAEAEFLAGRELVKNVTRIGEGPGGLSLRSDDAAVIDAYLPVLHAQRYVKPGFVTAIGAKNVLWVFRAGSPEAAAWAKGEEPAKTVTKVGATSDGRTIRSVDAETIDAYLIATPGFVTRLDPKGFVWAFAEHGESLKEFTKSGDLAKNVTRVGEGPGGRSVRGGDAAEIQAYISAPK